MNVSYKGVKKELAPEFQVKLDAKFAKLSKLLEKRGEKAAHVVVKTEGRLHHAEVTIQFYDHQLAGAGSNADLFTALHSALEKIEKQALKQSTKWRETRRKEAPTKTSVKQVSSKPAGAKAKKGGAGGQQIFKVKDQKGKPMTLDEAVMEMEKGRDYLVYRDADKDKLSVLVRRRDGHFDLIEG